MRLDMPCMETKQLFLRPMEREDACDVYAYYSDPLVMRYLSLPLHKDIDQTLDSMNTYFLNYEKRGVPQTWAMVHKETDTVIGNLDVHTIHEDIGEIGYLMHRAYWKQGLMKEALSALVDVSFAHLQLRRLEAYVAVENVASVALLQHCGFVQEGILRQYAILQDGKYHDMILLSRLSSDKGERCYEEETT